MELLGAVALEIDGVNPDIASRRTAVFIGEGLYGTAVPRVALVVRQNDDPVGSHPVLPHFLERQSYIGAAAPAVIHAFAENTGVLRHRHLPDLSIKRIEKAVVADTASDESQQHRHFLAAHVGFVTEAAAHRTRYVHRDDGGAVETGHILHRNSRRLFQRGQPPAARKGGNAFVGGEKPEGQLTGTPHRFGIFYGLPDLFEIAGIRLKDIAQVAQQRHVTHLAAVNQRFPCLGIIALSGEFRLPCHGRGKLVFQTALPQRRLRLVLGLGSAEAQQIAHFDRLAAALVFGERIFIKAFHHVADAPLERIGNRLAEGLEVERHDFGHVVAALRHAAHRFTHKGLAFRLVRQIRGQHVRHRAHMEFPPRKDRQLGDKRRVGFDNRLNGFPHLVGIVAVKFGFIEERGQHLRDQPGLRAHGIRRIALAVDSLDGIGLIELGHEISLL